MLCKRIGCVHFLPVVAWPGTIPHGDSALALGESQTIDGAPVVPDICVLSDDLGGFYLSRYKHFHDNPFKGDVTALGFTRFNLVSPNDLLEIRCPVRSDGQGGLIRWPHVSINVMEKVAEPDPDSYQMLSG